jgi:hypothetical protein
MRLIASRYSDGNWYEDNAIDPDDVYCMAELLSELIAEYDAEYGE